jgi:hypothetical protein
VEGTLLALLHHSELGTNPYSIQLGLVLIRYGLRTLGGRDLAVMFSITARLCDGAGIFVAHFRPRIFDSA